jgi:hypothetical protein
LYDEQRAFVVWWQASVRDAGGDRQTAKALTLRDVNALSVADATKQTGITIGSERRE